MEVKEVSLYQNGMGVFSGEVNGNHINIKLKHMNDVLKTIKVFDKGGNLIPNLTFPSPKSTGEDVKVDFDNPLLSILRSLKGVKIKVIPITKKSSGIVCCCCGVVMGIREEKVFVQCHNKSTLVKTRHKLVLMTIPDEEDDDDDEEEDDDMDFNDLGEEEGEGEEDEGCKDEDFYKEGCKLKQFYVDELKSIDLLEGSRRIEDYLDVQNMSRSDSKIKLKIHGGSAPYRVIYANLIALWKSVYEVDIMKKSLTLYSVIDNNSSHDWKKIILNLVSEFPYRVEANLFSILQVELRYKKGVRKMELMAEEAAEPMEFEEATVSEIGAIKGTFEQFTRKGVVIEQNESSKVLLKNYKVETEEWLHYSCDNHPDMAVVVTMKGSGLSIAGPLTVYNGGKYLGECGVNKIKGNNEMNFFRYAKDVQCEIKRLGRKNLIMIKVQGYSKLVIKMRRYLQRVTHYSFKYTRDSPIKIRVIHELASTNTLSPDELKEFNLKESLIFNIIPTKGTGLIKTPTTVETTLTADLKMNKSFQMYITEFYYKDEEYNLLNRMHIFSLLNLNLVLDPLKAIKTDLIKHAEMKEKIKRIREERNGLESRILTEKLHEGQIQLLTEKINKLDSEIEGLESDIKEFKNTLKNLDLKKDSKLKVEKIDLVKPQIEK